jgi:hypothetical protein
VKDFYGIGTLGDYPDLHLLAEYAVLDRGEWMLDDETSKPHHGGYGECGVADQEHILSMMKGWMDRVFAEGSAYAFEKASERGHASKGLLHTRVAVVFDTSNTEEERKRTVFGDPLERPFSASCSKFSLGEVPVYGD